MDTIDIIGNLKEKIELVEQTKHEWDCNINNLKSLQNDRKAIEDTGLKHIRVQYDHGCGYTMVGMETSDALKTAILNAIDTAIESQTKIIHDCEMQHDAAKKAVYDLLK